MASALEPAPAPDARAVERAAVYHALRVALAATATLAVCVLLELPRASVAVWTTHMVMSTYTYTIFQKGVERVLGRGLGILLGWALVSLMPDAWFPRMLLELMLVSMFVYLYLAQRLAYTFLNAGMYIVAMVGISEHSPDAVIPEGIALFVAVTIGVVMADLVIWLTGLESEVRVDPGATPLFPLRADWVNHGIMAAVTSLLTLWLTVTLGLPTESAIISVLVMGVMPDVQTEALKGGQRFLGAILGTMMAAVIVFFVARVPHVSLLGALLFVGMLIASYLSRTAGKHAYVGVQMGLVLPMLVVMPPDHFGDLAGGAQRIAGVLSAIAVTVTVATLWPRVPPPSAAHK